MVNNIDHWSIFSTTLFTFFPDSYVTHAAIYFSFQLSFSLVQMQPLEPFQVLQSEDPQVFPYMRISPNLPQNCPRRATTARPGSPSEFNDFSSHLFFINICQQVSSHIAKKKPQTLFWYSNLLCDRPPLSLQSSWLVGTSWQCPCPSQVEADLPPIKY